MMNIKMWFIVKDDFEMPKDELGELIEFIKWSNEIK